MYLYDVVKHLERRAEQRNLHYRIIAPLSELALTGAEERIGITFPFQVRQFYQHYGGIQIDEPPFEVLPVDRMVFVIPQRLHFATVDSEHCLCFDTSHINEAGQWDIRALATDECVTLTIASFWSNKIWAWVDKRRPIWRPEAVYRETRGG